MSRARRRQAVAMLRDRLGVSECRIAGQQRSTQRREPTSAGDDAALRAALRKIAGDHPRWGYRRAHHELSRDGWEINRKRVQRLWREEGLRAERPDHVRALDFQHDQSADGRTLRLVNVIDEFTREALIMRCERSITADQTVAALEALVAARGSAPSYLRCDNGPELTSHTLRDWCRFSLTQTAFIDPGAPWQNGFVESFHARVRDELLNVEQFACLAEAQVLIGDWREHYNTRRPHSALGMRTPTAFAAAWAQRTPRRRDPGPRRAARTEVSGSRGGCPPRCTCIAGAVWLVESRRPHLAHGAPSTG